MSRFLVCTEKYATAVVPPDFAVPAPTSWPARWPSSRDHGGGSDPQRQGKRMNKGMNNLPLPRGASATKIGGSLPPPAFPLVRRAVTPDGRGTREAQPRFTLSH